MEETLNKSSVKSIDTPYVLNRVCVSIQNPLAFTKPLWKAMGHPLVFFPSYRRGVTGRGFLEADGMFSTMFDIWTHGRVRLSTGFYE